MRFTRSIASQASSAICRGAGEGHAGTGDDRVESSQGGGDSVVAASTACSLPTSPSREGLAALRDDGCGPRLGGVLADVDHTDGGALRRPGGGRRPADATAAACDERTPAGEALSHLLFLLPYSS